MWAECVGDVLVMYVYASMHGCMCVGGRKGVPAFLRGGVSVCV